MNRSVLCALLLASFASVPASAQSSPPTWISCASEGATCSFTGARKVRYGTATQYVTKQFTTSTACTVAKFGSDPAVGQPKTCRYEKYAKIQMFAMANSISTTAEGEAVILKVRFFGVPTNQPLKVATHFVPVTITGDYTDAIFPEGAYNIVNHSEYVPANTWNGYVEYDYTAPVPTVGPAEQNAGPQTYRVYVTLASGLDPWPGKNDIVECNGIARANVTTYSYERQPCLVGTITVNPSGWQYTAPGRTWAP